MIGRGRFGHVQVDPVAGVPPPPRVPSPAAKRLVFAYAGGQQALLLIGVIFTLVGTLVGCGLGMGVPVDLAISVAGQTVDGTVTNVGVDRHVEINGEHPTLVSYRYRAAGQSFTAETSTMNEQAAHLRPGSRVTVEVLRASPGLSRLAGESYSVFGVFGLFPLLFAVIGLPMALHARAANQREIRAYTQGEATIGKLLSFDMDRTVRINRRHPWMLRWEYFVDGHRYTGSLSAMDHDVLAPYATDELAILYDPAEPSTNTLYVP